MANKHKNISVKLSHTRMPVFEWDAINQKKKEKNIFFL